MAGGIRILHVDDDHSFSTLVRQFLTRQNDSFEILTETSAKGGVDRLDDERIDCIVSDHKMPEMDGLAFLEAVREAGYEIPFIMFTGSGGDDLASEAISAGVTDYIKRGDGTEQYAVLAKRIETAVENYRSRRELEAAKRRLSLLIEQSPLGVVEWTDRGRIARVNEATEEIFGYDASELTGQSWETLLPDGSPLIDCDSVEEMLSEGGEHHSVLEMATADGEPIICESHNHIVTDEDRTTVAAFSQFQDVTEHRRIHRRLETMIDNLPGIVYRHSEQPDQPFELVRGSCEELTGYTAEELREEVDLAGELVHPDDREYVRTELLAREASDDGYELTYRIRRKDDEIRWTWEHGQTYEYLQDGRQVHEGLLIDVTDVKRKKRERV